MAEIKKIKLGSTTYDIRDTSAASKTQLNNNIHSFDCIDITDQITSITKGIDTYQITLPNMYQELVISCSRIGSGPSCY